MYGIIFNRLSGFIQIRLKLVGILVEYENIMMCGGLYIILFLSDFSESKKKYSFVIEHLHKIVYNLGVIQNGEKFVLRHKFTNKKG